jgi:ABC-type multidrug transport system fused ATPase/permease subunit
MLINNVIPDFWKILSKKRKGQAKIFVFLSIGATLFETFSIALIMPLLIIMAKGDNDLSFKPGLISSLEPLLVHFSLKELTFAIVIIYTLKNLYLSWVLSFQSKFIFGVEKDLSIALFRNYLEQPYSQLVEKNSSKLINNIIGEAGNFAHNALAPLCGLLAELFVVLGIFCLLLSVNFEGTLISCILLILAASVFYSAIRQRVKVWGDKRHLHEAMRIKSVQESMGAIKEIKIGSFYDLLEKDYGIHTGASTISGCKQQTLQNIPRLFLEILTVIALVLVVVFSEDALNGNIIPMLGLYAAASFRLMPSVNRILNSLQALRYSKAGMDAVTLEFSNNIKNSELNQTESELVFEKHIKLRDVNFEYGGGDIIFENINLEIKKGEIVCITGPSGSGKSTLVDLICGLLKPTAGSILVDDLTITNKEPMWHKHISYVPQSVFLIDGSIRENVTFGYEGDGIDDAKVLDALRCCGVNFLNNKTNGGLNFQVGERGSRLSGGQKQRVGLARGIYRSKNLLVLDEATNALDALVESTVLANIAKLKHHGTVIWISHGDAPLKYADKIINIKNKKIFVEIKSAR